MSEIEYLHALEILDSRGWPTIKTTCRLVGGAQASASVPSGRSTGEAEACELRDQDLSRYHGKGCRQAVENVNIALAQQLAGRRFNSQRELDDRLVAIDGSADKSRLGANAILSVSLAFARASAQARNIELFSYFSELTGTAGAAFPRLTINLFSGGRHAGKQVAIQDVLVVPTGARSIDESLTMMNAIYHAAADLTYQRFGMRLLTADEGGLAPPFSSSEMMLATAVEAISLAGFTPGRDVDLALDLAASHFFRDGRYHLDGEQLSGAEMIARLVSWCEQYPIVSLEDGLHEDDWENWPTLCRELGHRVLILGDDLLCTNPDRIRRAIDCQACNGLLLKVNQIGTLSEAAQAYELARSAGWLITLSVRSGETEDDWAADLCLGWAADQFKNGSITQSERLAKYNRLLEIEAQQPRPIVLWPERTSR